MTRLLIRKYTTYAEAAEAKDALKEIFGDVLQIRRMHDGFNLVENRKKTSKPTNDFKDDVTPETLEDAIYTKTKTKRKK